MPAVSLSQKKAEKGKRLPREQTMKSIERTPSKVVGLTAYMNTQVRKNLLNANCSDHYQLHAFGEKGTADN